MGPLLASQMFSVWLGLVTIQITSDLNMFSLPLKASTASFTNFPLLSDGYRGSWHHYRLMFPVSGGAIPKSG
jgi:hypothetical protein